MKLPVLVYQQLGVAPRNSHLKHQWTRISKLEKDIIFLKKHGYSFVTPAVLNSSLPAQPVMLTFWGGYQSFYTDVFALLKQHQVKATVFVAVDTLNTYDSWKDPTGEPWQNVLTVSQLQEMYKSNYVCVGTLGLTGTNLLKESSTTTAREEMLESIHRLKALHNITACAVGFWPGTHDRHLARTQAICENLTLPVLTSLYGNNKLPLSPCLKVLRPTAWTRLRLRLRH